MDKQVTNESTIHEIETLENTINTHGGSILG